MRAHAAITSTAPQGKVTAAPAGEAAATARATADLLAAPVRAQPDCTEARMVLLRCPRCALEMQVRARWLAVEYCPRCIARSHMAVRLRED